MKYYYWWTDFNYGRYGLDKPKFGPITVFRQPSPLKIQNMITRQHLVNGEWVSNATISSRYGYKTYREAMAAFYKVAPNENCLNWKTGKKKG